MPDQTTRSQTSIKIELPPAFCGDGTEDFGKWVRRLEVAIAASSDHQESDLKYILPARLSGAAFSYWDSLPDPVKKDFKQVRDKMKTVFCSRHFITTFQSFLNARPRYPGESLEVFGAEITRLVEEAFPSYDEDARKGERFRRFVAGLHPHLQRKVHEQGAVTFDDALRIAGRIEHAFEACSITQPPSSSVYQHNPYQVPYSPPPSASVAPPAHASVAPPHASTAVTVSAVDQSLEKLVNKVDSLVSRVEKLEVSLQSASCRHCRCRDRDSSRESISRNTRRYEDTQHRGRNGPRYNNESFRRQFSPSPSRYRPNPYPESPRRYDRNYGSNTFTRSPQRQYPESYTNRERRNGSPHREERYNSSPRRHRTDMPEARRSPSPSPAIRQSRSVRFNQPNEQTSASENCQ